MKLISANFVFIIILIVIQFNYGCSETTKDNQTQVIVTPEYLTSNKLFNFLHPNVNLTLQELISVEEETWHFMPYKRIQYFVSRTRTCREESDDEIETGVFTLDQLRSGAVILHLFGVAYLFALLTVVCNDYFLPALAYICEDLGLSADVGAATFMAIATTSPEFFINTISTFITESDLGIGTIVGSLTFGTLGVAASAALAAPKPVQLDWWPITRDAVLFSIILSFMVGFIWDGAIYWYEALVMLCLSVLYFCIVFNSHHIMKFVKKYVEGKWDLCQSVRNNIDLRKDEQTQPTAVIPTLTLSDDMGKETNSEQIDKNLEKAAIPEKEPETLWKIPKCTKVEKCWWFFVWPIRFILFFTIPNPKKYRKWYPLSFIMCMVWIGANAFMIVELIIIVGRTVDVPDSVMGLTFLAAGGCLPEAISAVIQSRKGEGDMGVSNSLGANSLSVLYSLSFPWFIKTMVDGGPSTSAYVEVNSFGIEYIFLALVLLVALLYTTISSGGFTLRPMIGAILTVIYLCFITTTILIELDVLFPSGNTC